MIPAADLLTILLMAAATYSTRLAGYLLLRNRTLSERAQAVLNAAPGCVFVAVIVPFFVTTKPADLIALAVAIVAATRLPMLATVIAAIGSAGLLRLALP